MVTEFRNESLLDFSVEENRRRMERTLEKVKRELGKEYPIIIGGEEIFAQEKFSSYNPSHKNQVVGTFQKATKIEGDKAIEVATKTFEEWKFVPAEERAAYLFKVAALMRERRFELDAWMIYETGKNWIEADADLCETIDFLEFYGREILRLSQPQSLTPLPGEVNELWYIPLGVGVVIPPWNFPMAIMAGMTSASFVSGNTVILKPSSDSPLIAYKFMEVLKDAGLPPGVVNFVSGPGSTVGNSLVAHPKTRFIAFTGSKEVGLGIVELAGKTQASQIWIKRVIVEMGGKDTIIVDSEAELDKAVDGVLVSAYGFQGQKCSACSRAIVVKDVYDEFLDKLVERAKEIKIGPAENYENFMGPVINEKAFKSIMDYIEIGKNEGRLVCGGESEMEEGWFIKPTIIADIDPDARISQEEIFGPVLAVIKAEDFNDALRIANNTIYGLTGAVYTKNREKIAKTKKIFHVGNLYINRKCTGAIVDVHPFGGFNMSGTDSKAGGRDYLLLFTQAKSISEKIL